MPNQLRARPAARLGAITGAVVFEGFPVPHCIVSVEPDEKPWAGTDPLGRKRPHPGSSRREFLVVDGTFHVGGIEPGNYAVSALFQFGSMATMPTKPFPFRVSIGADGETRIFDVAGKPLGAVKKIELSLDAEVPAKKTMMGAFRATVRFLDSAPSDLECEPIFLAAREIQGRSKWLAAAKGPIRGREVSLELAVPAGFRYILQLQSTRWAPVSCIPQTDQIEVGRKPVEMTISVARAGSIHISVIGPDGKPYTPSLVSSGADCPHYLDMRLLPDAMCFDRMISPDGTLSLLGVPPGTYVGETFARGTGFQWSVPGLPGIRVEAGKTAQAELRLKKGVAVRIKPGAATLPAPGHSSKVGVFDGRERWVRALKAGTLLDRREALRLFIREFHGGFQFKQDFKNNWHAPQAAAAGLAWAEPGRYDLYLLETSVGWGPDHYLRVVSRRKAFRVGEKNASEISFQGLPLNWGNSTLVGEILNARELSEKLWSVVNGDFVEFLASRPTLILRDAQDHLAACAWAQPSKLRDDAGFNALIEALATGHLQGINELLRSSRYAYEIPHLPKGEYTLELWAPEQAPHKRTVRLDGKNIHKLDLDLHAA